MDGGTDTILRQLICRSAVWYGGEYKYHLDNWVKSLYLATNWVRYNMGNHSFDLKNLNECIFLYKCNDAKLRQLTRDDAVLTPY